MEYLDFSKKRVLELEKSLCKKGPSCSNTTSEGVGKNRGLQIKPKKYIYTDKKQCTEVMNLVRLKLTLKKDLKL